MSISMLSIHYRYRRIYFLTLGITSSIVLLILSKFMIISSIKGLAYSARYRYKMCITALTNCATELVAPYSSVVWRSKLSGVWIAVRSLLARCKVIWLYLERKSSKVQTSLPATYSENLSILGGSIASRTITTLIFVAKLINLCFLSFFSTKN
jgi:hypothetical protein